MYIYIYTLRHIYVHTYIHRILFSSKKEVKAATCNNMDEAGGHYAKQNKQDTERETVHDLTYKWNLK